MKYRSRALAAFYLPQLYHIVCEPGGWNFVLEVSLMTV